MTSENSIETPAPKPAPERKFNDPRSRIKKGKLAQGVRLLHYGPGGVGKSSLVAQMAQSHRTLVLGTEDGNNHLDLERIEYKYWGPVRDKPESMQDNVLGFLRWFASREAAEYEALAIDTMDWLERMIVEYVCNRDNGTTGSTGNKPRELVRDGKPNLAKYGFGEGPQVVAAEWQKAIALFDEARKRRNVHIVLVAHAMVGKEKNPAGEDYGQIMPALCRPSVELFEQWVDAMLYMNVKHYEVQEADKDGFFKTRAKAVSDGDVYLFTRTEQAHRAKNRLGLHNEIKTTASDPGWREVHEAAVRTYGDPAVQMAAQRKRIEELITRVDDPALVTEIKRIVATQKSPMAFADALAKLESRVRQ